METKNREKTLLIVVGGCVALWLLNVIIISPLTASWNGRQERIVKLQKEIKDGQMLEHRAAALDDRWDRMKTNTLSSNPTVAEGQLYNSFEGWARTSGLTLVGQRPQLKDSDDPEYSNIEWRADATASGPNSTAAMMQIVSFLYAMESSPMALKVDVVELTSRDDTGRQLGLGLTVSGLILNASTNSTP